MKITKRTGDESSIRKVRDDHGNPVGIYGKVGDMQRENLLIGDYSEAAEKWLFVSADAAEGKEFDSKEEVKAYLETICL